MNLFSSNNKLDVTLLTFVSNKYINMIINKSNNILLDFKHIIKVKVIF